MLIIILNIQYLTRIALQLSLSNLTHFYALHTPFFHNVKIWTMRKFPLSLISKYFDREIKTHIKAYLYTTPAPQGIPLNKNSTNSFAAI